MNAKQSLIVFLIAILLFVGAGFAFIHGASHEETLPKILWTGGSALVGAAVVLLSTKIFKK